MAEPLSVTMLRKKRDKIRDTIAAYEARLREAQADLTHVNATMQRRSFPFARFRATAFSQRRAGTPAPTSA